MTLTEETINRLLPQMRGQSNQAEWLASRLQELNDRQSLEDAQASLERRQAEERAELAARWESFREACRHPETTCRGGTKVGVCVCAWCGREL